MTIELVTQLNELVISLNGLINSQSNIEKKLIAMIEDSETRSIKRNEDGEKRLNERLEAFIHDVKNDIKDPLNRLLKKSDGQEYHERHKRWYLNLINGFLGVIIIGFGSAFIGLLIDNSDNKKAILQESSEVEDMVVKIDKLEEIVYSNVRPVKEHP